MICRGTWTQKFAVIIAVAAWRMAASNSPVQAEQPRMLYGVQALPTIRVRMRDGVELAVRIIRPDAEGQFPTIMAYSPYRMLSSFKKAPESEYTSSLSAPYYFAQHGYISVNFDVRGTGASGGSTSEMYSEAERQDGYDMVEWIAAQPWSNGNVGMWGLSYAGVAAWQVALMAPPHLKAIIVRGGTEDGSYNDWTYPGGVPRSFMLYGFFAAFMAASNFAPPDLEVPRTTRDELWEERLQKNVPWSISDIEHQTNDAYWRARSVSDFGKIKAAVFMIEGWNDWYPSAVLRAFTKLKNPKRAIIGPWGHQWPEEATIGPRIDARSEYLKWFDQFLKGIDSGVLQEPPVTIYVRRYQPPAPIQNDEPGFWRSEREWPPARTRYTPMYLAARGRLTTHPEANDQPAFDRYDYRASVGAMSGILASRPSLDQRSDEAYSLTYTTEALEADLEVTGTPKAELFVSSSAEVAYFHVRLSDVAPDGTSKLVSDGGMNATHRISHSAPDSLKPGQIFPLTLDLKSLAYVFAAGHRIRVSVSSADFQNAWPVSRRAINSLVRAKSFPSRVTLPEIPPQGSPTPAVHFPPSPNQVNDSHAQSDYRITYDLVKETTTLSMENKNVFQSTYRVSDQNPADVEIKSSYHLVVPGSEGDIEVTAHAVTSSDAAAFCHIVDVDITVNGMHRFSKSWQTSVPRILN